eukprot:7893691-Heterocapsa_arctica.AAC.1
MGSMQIFGKDGNPQPGKTSKEPKWSDGCLRMSSGGPGKSAKLTALGTMEPTPWPMLPRKKTGPTAGQGK